MRPNTGEFLTLRMKPISFFAALAIGATMFIAGACGGDDNAKTPPADTATNTATATETNTPAPTPTATPTPFDGAVTRIRIPRFGIDAPIEQLGVDSGGNMETPADENHAVGWYPHLTSVYRPDWPSPGWDKPGWGGNATFSAHVYYHNIPAPFVSLAKAAPGDEISVAMEDGTTYTYKVISNERYGRDSIPMGDILWPNKPADKEWITLITCGGELDSTGWEYLSRDVVVAERQL